MPIDEQEFGRFEGATGRALQDISKQLERGNHKFDSLEKRVRALETRNPNGWRGAIRPSAIGTGAATIAVALWEAIKAMAAGG